jgi:hypothetical protein
LAPRQRGANLLSAGRLSNAAAKSLVCKLDFFLACLI